MDKFGCDEFTVKRSRFIGYAKPVSSQEEAVAFINEIKAKHWDAKHNVYAYIVREQNIKRYSDDGEPQGTAGTPVLDVLEKSGVTDCVTVVTRYFGGVLLGGGGLVRAYSHSASIALAAAGIVRMKKCSRLKVKCDYGFYGRLASLIPEYGGKDMQADFTDEVAVGFTIADEDIMKFASALTDAGNGKYDYEVIAESFEKFFEKSE